MQLRSGLAALSLLLAIAAPLRAQIGVPEPSGDSAGVAPVVTDSIHATNDVTNRTASETGVAGASMTGLRAGVHLRETSRPSAPTMAAPARAGLGQARAMMVVGVAALVAGAIIGGDPGTIVMVGGAVIGLIGLYEYLQ